MALRPRESGSGQTGKKWMAIFIGVIMLMSVAGFVLSFSPGSQGGNFRYGGLDFTQTGQGFYSADIGGRDVGFFYRPEDVSGIDVPDEVAGKISGTRALYVSYGWNSSLSREMALLQFDLGNMLDARGVFAQPAFTGENPMNITVKGCNDATGFVPVLLLQEANNTAVGVEAGNPDCLVLNATDGASFLRLADRLKYVLIAGERE